MKKVPFLVIVIFLSACIAMPTPEPTATTARPAIILVEENPYRPQPEDVRFRQGSVVMTTSSLLERFDLDPFRVELIISGSMPRVCNELRIDVSPPNESYQIFIEVYSLANPHINCDNVFQQFEASLLLGVYSTGRYTVWVNETLIGDFITY